MEDVDDNSFHNDTLLDEQNVTHRHRPMHPYTDEEQPRANVPSNNRPAHLHNPRLNPPPRHAPVVDDQALLTDQRAINNLVNSAVTEFGASRHLKPDGSNYRTWLKDMEMIGLNFLQDKDFFNGPCIRPRMSGAGRRILLAVVDPSMKSELYSLDSAFSMMEALKARFSGVSKARMIAKWQELRRISVDMGTNPASVATQMKAIIDELNDMGCYLSYDDVLPLIIHEAVAQGSPLRFEFDRRIDAEFSLNNHHPITFEKTWKTLSAAINQVQASSTLDDRQTGVRFMSSSAQAVREDSIISHEDNVYVMASNPNPSKRVCFRCKSTTHLIGQCTAADPNQNRQARPQYISHTNQPFNAYYPILAPSGTNVSYYPVRQSANPNMIPLGQPKMDSYRP
jgi:hypothetical protein